MNMADSTMAQYTRFGAWSERVVKGSLVKFCEGLSRLGDYTNFKHSFFISIDRFRINMS